MINPKQRVRLMRAINRLVRANEADAFKGAGRPDDYDAIEHEFRQAKANLKRVLDALTVHTPNN